jgi:integrase
MATIRKLPSGSWQAMVRRKGDKVLSKTFLVKAHAEKWARQIEIQLESGAFINQSALEKITFSELAYKYKIEITPQKKGHIQESYRIDTLCKQFGNRSLATILPKDIALYRDSLLHKGLSGGTVTHELNLLSKIFDTAIRDWGMPLQTNPVTPIRKPKKSRPRNRRLETNELERLLLELRSTEEMIDIVLLATETAMRRSELLSLEWAKINLKDRTVNLSDTKNGCSREVPLSPKAVMIIKAIPQRSDKVFNTKPCSVSHAFNRACVRAGIKNLRFHDLRHEGTTRFFELGLNTMEVSTITGHKSLAMLARYTHLRAADLALKL